MKFLRSYSMNYRLFLTLIFAIPLLTSETSFAQAVENNNQNYTFIVTPSKKETSEKLVSRRGDTKLFIPNSDLMPQATEFTRDKLSKLDIDVFSFPGEFQLKGEVEKAEAAPEPIQTLEKHGTVIEGRHVEAFEAVATIGVKKRF